MFLKKFNHVSFIDIETTGTDPNKNATIEFAGLTITRNLKNIIQQTSFVICPDNMDAIEFDPEAMRINKIKLEEIKQSKKIGELQNSILSFFQPDSLIVGHNFNFDILFLDSLLKHEHTKTLLKPRYIDTASLLLPLVMAGKIPKNTMNEGCKFFGIDTNNSHRAFNDVVMTCDLFRKLIVYYKNNIQI